MGCPPSILGRKQQRGGRAIRLRDDPNPLTSGEVIRGEQTEGARDGKVVFVPVVLRECAPVPAGMTRQQFSGVLSGVVERLQRAGGSDDTAKRKEWTCGVHDLSFL